MGRRMARQKHDEQYSMGSLSFLVGFAILMFVIAPLFNDASIEGKVIAPPPPPPTPSMTGGTPESYDSFADFPEAPFDPNMPPDDPAALDAPLFGGLPDEPPSPSSNNTSSGATSGGTGSSSITNAVSGGAGSSGQQASDYAGDYANPSASVRGKQHVQLSSSGGGSSGSRRTGASNTSSPTPPPRPPSQPSGLAPRVGAASSSGIPVQTTPSGDTQVIKPITQTPAPPREELLFYGLPGWALYAAVGFFVVVFSTIIFIIVYLHYHGRKKMARSVTSFGQQNPSFDGQKIKFQQQPQQQLPNLPLQDPEVKEIYAYLHDNMGKGYPLEALQEALLKNGFSKDKVQQVASYLQAGQQAEAAS